MPPSLRRYAVYFTPPTAGALAGFGAAWLGWDIARGVQVAHPVLPGLAADIADITAAPRRYGLHATIKPPFRLQEDRTPQDLRTAFDAFCATCPPVRMQGLRLAPLGRFLALVPDGPADGIAALAASAVATLDVFRAPATPQELRQRRAAGLTAAQDRNLVAWGYPHVMDGFRFHITLTGKLPRAQVEAVRAALAPVLAPLLPTPFVVDGLTLVGEDATGRFHALARAPLSGGMP